MLKGKRVLVTGSSRGIGRAIAWELAGRGAQVAVHGPAIDAELQASFDRVGADSPGSIMVRAELSEAREIEAMFVEIEERWAGLDVLVNNAAAQNPSPFLDLKEEDWDRILAVNLKAPFLCAQHAARLMMRGARGGRIINISSVHAYQPRRHFAHYSASKAGLEQLTRSIALELGEHNIQSISVVLGAIATDLTPADRQNAFSTAIPMGRVGRTDEIAGIVAFLCSDACAYLTGTSITIDGGLTLGFCASRRDL